MLTKTKFNMDILQYMGYEPVIMIYDIELRFYNNHWFVKFKNNDVI